ncbi:39S ribosomal protein L2, mitochondrial [Orchesella cincta]|uniref:39S ribosomal protein L2, mitochondrial n=1 Tax=Orchesella cincta TaxID=48709 RepID=A0A1D2M2R6_ORCCI|nr:39S ribosomal protein L2, mitochondrial [Orchesella cincta]
MCVSYRGQRQVQQSVPSREFHMSFNQLARFKEHMVEAPKPGKGNYFRRDVHYPEKYTIKPIPYTNMAGGIQRLIVFYNKNILFVRIVGHVVVGTLGGGIKHPFLWVDYKRHVPEGMEGPLIERVLQIVYEPSRTAHVALVGYADKLRYIIATENMKPGDIIKTSNEITKIAVRANEGDAYPLGSLPVNTIICCVEIHAGEGGYFARAAGTCCKILRKIGQRVVVLNAKKREISLPQNCMAVVGMSFSNVSWDTVHIGSPNNLRRMGYRPRSGLWHRKTGYHGRKLRRPPPCEEYVTKDQLPKPVPRIKLTMDPDVTHTYFKQFRGTY